MARLCFFSYPYPGHTLPTLPVVAELVRRGEQVVYYSTATFETAVTATGARFQNYPNLGTPPSHQTGVDLVLWALKSTQIILDCEVENVRRHKPDYCIVDAMARWGSSMARAVGAPFIVSTPMFVMTPQVWALARQVMPASKWRRKSIPAVVAASWQIYRQLRRIRKSHGLRLRDDAPLHAKSDQIVYTSRLLQPFSDTLDERYRFVGPPGVERTETDDFAFDQFTDRPLVFVSMGTFLTTRPELLRTLFDAMENLDVQVLMVLKREGLVDLLDEAPTNFVFAQRVPQLKVLQRACLFINHGGVGGASEALFHGVPMIFMPEAFDQFLMAHRVAEEGAGILFAQTPDSSELTEAVERILSDASFAGHAKRLGSALAEAGGAVRAADEIIGWSRAEAGVT